MIFVDNKNVNIEEPTFAPYTIIIASSKVSNPAFVSAKPIIIVANDDCTKIVIAAATTKTKI